MKQVSPDLYGDNNTRLFTYWTVSPVIHSNISCMLFDCHCFFCLPASSPPFFLQSDAYQATGCYNLLCSGFIQINSDIAMGASISPVSAYRNSQYDISILVWKVKAKIRPLYFLNSMIVFSKTRRKIQYP